MADMTIKELYAAIKRETMNVNARLVSYYEDGKKSKLVDKEINILKQVSGTATRKPYLSLNLHRKNKTQLMAQLNFLRDFQKWDVVTPEGRRLEKERARQSYRSYKSTRPGKHIKFKTYRRAVTILGSMSAAMITSFNSEQILEAVEYAFKEGKSVDEIIQTFDRVYNESKGKGFTSEDYIDAWYRTMNL